MKSIRIQNLRSLKDTGIIELKPITVLVGENSSGKSTFLRTFPLFRQSDEVKKMGPILWFGKYVDFGGFDESQNAFSQEKFIAFEFDFGKISVKHRYLAPFLGLSNSEINLSLKFRIVKDKRVESVTNYCEIHLEDNTIILEFSPTGKVTRFEVNQTDFSNSAENINSFPGRGIFPSLLINIPDKNKKSGTRFSRLDYDWLFENKNINIEGISISKSAYEKILQEVGISASQEMFKKIKDLNFQNISKNKIDTSTWTSDNKEFIKLRDSIIASSIYYLFMFCNDIFSDFATKIHYIAPIRATAERYYRYQNLALDEVDFQGQNLAMFLQNLSQSERVAFFEWTMKLFGFSPQIIASQGHVSLAVNQGETFKFNVADTGFGISQVLPILTQLWNLRQNRFIQGYYPFSENSAYLAIEQPELHLHPRMQGKLADAFTDVVNYAKKSKQEIKLIIETHSDALINTFGHLVAKGILSPDDISIVIFEKPGVETNSKMYTSSFDSKGYLQNWPYGFFEPDWE